MLQAVTVLATPLEFFLSTYALNVFNGPVGQSGKHKKLLWAQSYSSEMFHLM